LGQKNLNKNCHLKYIIFKCPKSSKQNHKLFNGVQGSRAELSQLLGLRPWKCVRVASDLLDPLPGERSVVQACVKVAHEAAKSVFRKLIKNLNIN
jgi:hypothetical protein